MPPTFPFSAIVGQDALKRALLLGVIQPSLGGVLIRGTKGVAKSTAVRALAALLPPLATVADCPFQRSPGEAITDWPLAADPVVLMRPVPLVELPLGATEDRVLGALHLEKALRGERACEPGLLAAANRGLLYIDEVNLLPDHLVDVLLDVAASGVHRLERDGLSLSHPARFLLIGTMNPEEGELRPQLLDRFGLAVDATDLSDPADRADAVERRLAYEADPIGFAATCATSEAAEAERIVQAQRLLPEVRISREILEAVAQRCLAAGVEGLRADLTMCKAAAAWAAYHGRRVVESSDVDAVAELALAHRRTTAPPPGPRPNAHGSPENATQSKREGRPYGNDATTQSAGAALSQGEAHLESGGLYTAAVQPPLKQSPRSGLWRGKAKQRQSKTGGAARSSPDDNPRVAWAATLRMAARHQVERGRTAAAPCMILRAADLRYWPARGPVGCLLLFVVDASGSMAAWRRMRQTKTAILALLLQAYQHRDQVALLVFRGSGAELVLPPARGLAKARQILEVLPVGGATPLAHGLAAARRFIHSQQARQPIWTVVLTDGRANVALTPRSDPWRNALGQAQALATCGTDILVVDTETGWPRFGRAGELAQALGAACLSIEAVIGKPLAARRLAVS